MLSLFSRNEKWNLFSFLSFGEWKVKWKCLEIEIESEKWNENASRSRSRSEIGKKFSRILEKRDSRRLLVYTCIRVYVYLCICICAKKNWVAPQRRLTRPHPGPSALRSQPAGWIRTPRSWWDQHDDHHDGDHDEDHDDQHDDDLDEDHNEDELMVKNDHDHGEHHENICSRSRRFGQHLITRLDQSSVPPRWSTLYCTSYYTLYSTSHCSSYCTSYCTLCTIKFIPPLVQCTMCMYSMHPNPTEG